MSFKNIDASIPHAVREVERILNRHGVDRGIVHTHSYRLTRAVAEHLRGTKHAKRIITHDNTPGSRDRAIYEHINSTEPTVLLSPSMTEGLDLSEDLSRFQIIMKVPYPYLGDPFVRARMAHDARWLTWQTALTLVQATGRSIRSMEDRATTYVTDSDFDNFLARATDILPAWWKAALR
jgi:Rad3-related DNA helicase